MNKILSIILLATSFAFSQSTVETKFFSDKYGNNEVPKGPYMLTITKINDSVTNYVFLKTKSSQKIWTKSYLGDQPYGLWERFDRKGNLESSLDYNFVLKYGEDIPAEAIKFKEMGIDARSDSNSEKIQSHIRKNFRYPEVAQDKDIQGKVTVQFTIDKDGSVNNLSILEGVHISLDTECYRIMNSLKKLEPYSIQGKKVMVYYTMPITFRLV